jgi:hypothetical protein
MKGRASDIGRLPRLQMIWIVRSNTSRSRDVLAAKNKKQFPKGLGERG